MTLNQLRFQKYVARIKTSFILANLPPTESAAEQHCYRAYCQLQTSLGNKTTATYYRWKQHQYGVMPKLTDWNPGTLLKIICCSCNTGCNNLKCCCRKTWLKLCESMFKLSWL